MMLSYRSQIVFFFCFLIIFLFSGLFVTAINMEKVTLREGHDFLALIPQKDGLWEVRLLGSSLLINPESITQGIKQTFAEKIPRFFHETVPARWEQFGWRLQQYAADSYSYLEKTITKGKEQLSIWQEQLSLWQEQLFLRKKQFAP